MKQIWMELRGCLGDLARSIIKVKHVAGLNWNPHADVWVHKDTGATLVAVIRLQKKNTIVEIYEGGYGGTATKGKHL